MDVESLLFASLLTHDDGDGVEVVGSKLKSVGSISIHFPTTHLNFLQVMSVPSSAFRLATGDGTSAIINSDEC